MREPCFISPDGTAIATAPGSARLNLVHPPTGGALVGSSRVATGLAVAAAEPVAVALGVEPAVAALAAVVVALAVVLGDDACPFNKPSIEEVDDVQTSSTRRRT